MGTDTDVLVAEFTVDHPAFREALARVPEVTLTWEQSDATERNTIQTLVWVEGGDFDRFEAALEADPTVSTPQRTVEFGDRRFYWVEVTNAYRPSIYSVLVDEGSIIERLVGTRDGWEFRVRFSDREEFARFRQFCDDRGLGFELHRLSSVPEGNAPPDRYGLTPKQQEALVCAFERGYFQVPRGASLDEVAAALGVSHNAASGRLRRGLETLLENTLAPASDRP